MKTIARLSIAVLLLVVVMMVVAASIPRTVRAAGPWYVAPGGSDGNTCLSAVSPCTTINGAIGKASSGDTIYVAMGTYTSSVGSEVASVTKSIDLSGGWDATFITQTGTSTIDGQGTRRGITLNSGITVTVDHFIIQNGFGGGGGIYNGFGNLTVSNSKIINNISPGNGGGIISSGTFTLTDSTVSDNISQSWMGGGIYNINGTMTISNTTISGNSAGDPCCSGGGSGGGIENYSGSVTLNNSIISGNSIRGSGEGGGINNFGTLTLNNSIVSNNTGGVGIYTGVGGLSVLTLNNSTVSNNTGGGISNLFGILTLNNSTVSNNAGDAVGGIYNYSGGTVTLNNSTVSGNTNQNVGGGIYNNYGAGTVTLNNSTISGNAGSSGGGIYNFSSGGSVVTMRNSILAGNTSAGAGPDCNGPIGSSGYNLVGNIAGCSFTSNTGDLTNTNPKLGSLIGSPAYRPLLLGSPAIDAGNPAGCMGSAGLLITDQRGAARVGRCDIGAYEYTPPGSAASLVAISGTPQHALPFSAFGMPLQVAVLDSIGSPVSNTVVTFSAPTSGASGTFAPNGTYTMAGTANESGVVTAAAFTANGITGNYIVTATASGVITPANFLLSNMVWYVATNGNNSNDCQTPAMACATINGVLAKGDFIAGDTVLVGNGTYTSSTGSEVVLLNKSVTLSGGWNSTYITQTDMSIIDGQGARRGITVNSSVTAILGYFIIRDGSSTSGGGIYNSGTLAVTNSTVTSNTTSSDGGGILNLGILTLNDSAISNNIALESGGIGNGGYFTGLSITMALNNSTVSNNTAQSRGGGIGNYSSGTLNLNNATVSGNTSSYFPGSGGIFNANGSVTLQNSIVAGNTSSDSGNGPDCFGTIRSAGYNLIGNTASCTFNATTGDLLNINANLWPWLIGSPGTHPLLPGSPAINAGNPTGCKDNLGNPLNTDERGVARVGRCDIGAYEYDPNNYPFKQVFLSLTARNYCAGPSYTDDFSNPASGWPVGDSGSARYEYLSGEYRILLRNTNWSALVTPGLKASDSIVAVDVRNATGVYGSYGLLFGLSDDFSQFYDFEIDPSGNYAIYRYDSGTFTPLAQGSSGSIHTGTATNRIKLERNGALIKAYANGQLLTSISDGSYTGLRRLGLIAFSYNQHNVDVRFDNFKAYDVACEAIATSLSMAGQITDRAALEMDGLSGSGTMTMGPHTRLDTLPADKGRH